jgi:hypothetical protein
MKQEPNVTLESLSPLFFLKKTSKIFPLAFSKRGEHLLIQVRLLVPPFPLPILSLLTNPGTSIFTG